MNYLSIDAFGLIFQVATIREGSGVDITTERPGYLPEAQLCFWWSRGIVELHLKHEFTVRILSDPQRIRHLPVFTATT